MSLAREGWKGWYKWRLSIGCEWGEVRKKRGWYENVKDMEEEIIGWWMRRNTADEKRMKRGWKEDEKRIKRVEKRMKRGRKEDEKRTKRGRKEDEKRMKRGWKEHEKRIKKRWKEDEKITDALYICRGHSLTVNNTFLQRMKRGWKEDEKRMERGWKEDERRMKKMSKLRMWRLAEAGPLFLMIFHSKWNSSCSCGEVPLARHRSFLSWPCRGGPAQQCCKVHRGRV